MDLQTRTRAIVDPNDYVRIVGKTFATHEHAPILTIGRHTYDRWRLGRLGCPHPVAAATLNRVIQELRITTFDGLARHANEIGKYKKIGITAYWLLLSILRERGYNITAVHGEDVTYLTLKRRGRKPGKRRRSAA